MIFFGGLAAGDKVSYWRYQSFGRPFRIANPAIRCLICTAAVNVTMQAHSLVHLNSHWSRYVGPTNGLLSNNRCVKFISTLCCLSFYLSCLLLVFSVFNMGGTAANSHQHICPSARQGRDPLATELDEIHSNDAKTSSNSITKWSTCSKLTASYLDLIQINGIYGLTRMMLLHDLLMSRRTTSLFRSTLRPTACRLGRVVNASKRPPINVLGR
jgi:hypothetical protein